MGSSIFCVSISSDARKIAFGFTLRERKINYAGPLEYIFDLDKMKLKVLKDEKGLLRVRGKRGNLSLELNPDLSYQLGLYSPKSLLDVKKENKVIARIIRDNTDGHLHNCFSFINDRFFVSGGGNGKVFVYNLRGEEVAELVGHEREVWAVADWTIADLYESRLMGFSIGSGVHVLSAATSQQLANEGYRGHGHFIYFVLKALDGYADTNDDRKITVVEMSPYVKLKVKKITKGAQKPITINYGKDVVMSKR